MESSRAYLEGFGSGRTPGQKLTWGEEE